MPPAGPGRPAATAGCAEARRGDQPHPRDPCRRRLRRLRRAGRSRDRTARPTSGRAAGRVACRCAAAGAVVRGLRRRRLRDRPGTRPRVRRDRRPRRTRRSPQPRLDPPHRPEAHISLALHGLTELNRATPMLSRRRSPADSPQKCGTDGGRCRPRRARLGGARQPQTGLQSPCIAPREPYDANRLIGFPRPPATLTMRPIHVQQGRSWRRSTACVLGPRLIRGHSSSARAAAARAAPSSLTGRYDVGRPISSAIVCAMTSGVASSYSIIRPAPCRSSR
jgi:hypothetical protein